MKHLEIMTIYKFPRENIKVNLCFEIAINKSKVSVVPLEWSAWKCTWDTNTGTSNCTCYANNGKNSDTKSVCGRNFSQYLSEWRTSSRIDEVRSANIATQLSCNSWLVEQLFQTAQRDWLINGRSHNSDWLSMVASALKKKWLRTSSCINELNCTGISNYGWNMLDALQHLIEKKIILYIYTKKCVQCIYYKDT